MDVPGWYEVKTRPSPEKCGMFRFFLTQTKASVFSPPLVIAMAENPSTLCALIFPELSTTAVEGLLDA
jgi:hypothetical protein